MQTSQLHPGQLKKRRAALGGIRTHDTLQSRRALYQLSYHMYTHHQDGEGVEFSYSSVDSVVTALQEGAEELDNL